VHAAGVGSDTAAVYIHAPAIHRDAHTLAALTAKRHAGAACNEPTSPAARRNQAVAVRHRRRRQLPLRRELPVVTPPLVAFVSTSLCQHRQLRPAHSCAATMELVRHRLPTANPPLTACRSSTGCDGLRGPGTPWLQSVRCAGELSKWAEVGIRVARSRWTCLNSQRWVASRDGIWALFWV
jgi:hypothetical protein